MKRRPKTGEAREVRQPLKIDKLPIYVHDKIQELRAQRKTWGEIEEMSAEFVKWDELPTPVLELFPRMRLPDSNLQRWFDIRVEQVRKEVVARTETAREFAAVFKDREFDDLDGAVINAIRDHVFTLMDSGASEANTDRFLAALGDFSLALTRITRMQLARKRLELETDKVDLARQQLELMKRKVGTLKADVEKKKLTPQELQQRLDDLYGITAS